MSLMLTPRELEDARSDILETLVSTCRIERATEGTSSSGIVSQSWGTAVASARCRIDPMNLRTNEGVVAEREASRARFRASFEWNVDIQEGDRVIFDSETFELIELHSIHSDRVATRAVLAKIEGA
jgi:hypothetical protein